MSKNKKYMLLIMFFLILNLGFMTFILVKTGLLDQEKISEQELSYKEAKNAFKQLENLASYYEVDDSETVSSIMADFFYVLSQGETAAEINQLLNKYIPKINETVFLKYQQKQLAQYKEEFNQLSLSQEGKIIIHPTNNGPEIISIILVGKFSNSNNSLVVGSMEISTIVFKLLIILLP